MLNKIPSNRMPKCETDRGEPKWYVSTLFWIFLILFLLYILYLLYALSTCENFRYIFLLFVVVVVAIFVQNIIYKRKVKKVLSSRENWNIGCFAKEFDLKVIDTWVIRAVYEAIYDLVELPIKADDDMDKDLGMDDLEFDDILINVSQRTGRVLPKKSDKYYDIKSVRDLVEFFSKLPKEKYYEEEI